MKSSRGEAFGPIKSASREGVESNASPLPELAGLWHPRGIILLVRLGAYVPVC